MVAGRLTSHGRHIGMFGRVTTDTRERPLVARPYRQALVICYLVASAATVPVWLLCLVGTVVAFVFTTALPLRGGPWVVIFVTMWLFLPTVTFFSIAIPWSRRIDRRYGQRGRSLRWAVGAWALIWVAHLTCVAVSTGS